MKIQHSQQSKMHILINCFWFSFAVSLWLLLISGVLNICLGAENSSPPSPISTRKILKPTPSAMRTRTRPTATSTTTTTTTTTTSTSTTSAPPITSTTDSPYSSSTLNEPVSDYSTTTAVGNSTLNNIFDICTSGLKEPAPELSDSVEEENARNHHKHRVRHEKEFVFTIEGEAMLSVLTTDPTSALFVINRVNQANLIEADFHIGIRAIHIDNTMNAESLLLQEVQYHQECVLQAIGIFLDYDLYKLLERTIKDLEYNIWIIPSAHSWIFPKVAHLLNQMPWGDKIASVEIQTENLKLYNEFMDAVRREHMCLMHFKSDENIYIIFGSQLAHEFKENGTIFAVSVDRSNKAFIAG